MDEFVGGAPVFKVEGRIGHDVVGLEVGVLILEEGIGGDFAEVGREPAHGEGKIRYSQKTSVRNFLHPRSDTIIDLM